MRRRRAALRPPPARVEYTEAEMRRADVRDLAVDIRCAFRDGLRDYGATRIAEFRRLWPLRHGAR